MSCNVITNYWSEIVRMQDPSVRHQFRIYKFINFVQARYQKQHVGVILGDPSEP